MRVLIVQAPRAHRSGFLLQPRSQIFALQALLQRGQELKTEDQQVKTIIRIIQRMCLGFVIWSIEQHIEDLQRVMRETNSLDHYRLAMIEREQVKRDLAKVRKEYGALLPIGTRRTWKTA